MPTDKVHKTNSYKTGVINDPLGHTHSLASSEHCFGLKFVFILKSGDGRTHERTTCAKAMITTGRDCGSASWIKKSVIDSKKSWRNQRLKCNRFNLTPCRKKQSFWTHSKRHLSPFFTFLNEKMKTHFLLILFFKYLKFFSVWLPLFLQKNFQGLLKKFFSTFLTCKLVSKSTMFKHSYKCTLSNCVSIYSSDLHSIKMFYYMLIILTMA